MEEFTLSVIEIIRAIPPGRVLSYGAVAAMAGDPRGARQVVRILHSLSDRERLPWHRVINSRGRIGLPDPVEYHEQRALLEREGVVFDRRGAVNMARYSWNPSD